MIRQWLACADCQGIMLLRRKLRRYVCQSCGATLRAHPDGEACGFPANRQTRALRIEAHKRIDALVALAVSKTTIYNRLAKHLGVTRANAHIGRMDEEALRRAVDWYRSNGYA